MSKSAIAKWHSAITRAASRPKILRMKDHPRIQLLERKLLLGSHPGRANPPELDRLIDEVSIELFGITSADTEFKGPADYDELPMQRQWAVDHQYDEYETPFDAVDLAPDQIVPALKRHGLDFTSERGQPLLCTKILSRQAIAAAKGIMGRMPDPADFQVKGFENWLQREAEAFTSRRRRD
ncbi:hypothetical protein [Kaistia sp. UC242_56]|uniref:hypothetical protein n=1 Tax=Kaistia sp. UC242_56 TaxID=3374625 RepID=UPI0037B08495